MQNDKPIPTTATEKVTEGFEALSINKPTEQSKLLATKRIQSALDYIDTVKGRFQEDQPQVYNEFLDVMKDYHNQRIDVADVIKRIESLFEGHSDLVDRFVNEFMPPDQTAAGPTSAQPQGTNSKSECGEESDGTGTTSPEDESRSKTPTPKTTQAMNTVEKGMPESTLAYIQRVKQQCDVETWQQFMALLRRRREDANTFSQEEMIKDVEELFEDHPDLRPGFRTFLASGGQ